MIRAIKILNWTFGLTRVYRIQYINTGIGTQRSGSIGNLKIHQKRIDYWNSNLFAVQNSEMNI